MFEREMIIASLRKEQNTLRELIEELEDQPRFSSSELQYCGEVLKKVESALKKLRRPVPNYGKYAL